MRISQKPEHGDGLLLCTMLMTAPPDTFVLVGSLCTFVLVGCGEAVWGRPKGTDTVDFQAEDRHSLVQ